MRLDRAKLPVHDLNALTDDELWCLHNDAIAAQSNAVARRSRAKRAQVSLLDVKIELAHRMLSSCRLCERHCGVDRTRGQTGFCGVGGDSFYFFEQTLWGEEPPLVPSHEVFFSGCNLRCKFCYSWESLFDTHRGVLFEPRAFADLVSSRRREGAANLNLIGGEPTVHLPSILKSLKLVDNPTPVVWNSNFHMSVETMRLLHGLVDLYLGDFRFGNDRCAQEIGGVSGYVAAAERNFLMAAESGDLIIRHLVLPGHVDCCLRPIAQWVARRLPDVPFNLMFQYTPFHDALDDPELCRSLTPEEELEATNIVSALGLNTQSWKRPLKRGPQPRAIGKGELTTTITIRPDGRVGVMHLHGELLDIVQSLAQGGQSDD